ncbi:MAG: hypothetical protein IJC88_04165 [Oscillospiraceae bacterium]|nr:hypothetical protein [Oscillospiraceae bacterium]
MTAALAALCFVLGLLCFRFGRKVLMRCVRLVLSGAGLILCSILGIPLGFNLITLGVVFFLGVPGLLALIAIHALI